MVAQSPQPKWQQKVATSVTLALVIRGQLKSFRERPLQKHGGVEVIRTMRAMKSPKDEKVVPTC